MSETVIHPISYDAVVIGAGAGGLSVAARLVAAGKKVLVAESLGRVGGRASSEQIDGFTVNIGAIAIEKGSTFEETFALLDVELDLREPNPATVFLIDGKIINVAKGGWGMLLGGFTKQAAKIGAKFADARGGDLPEAKLTTKEWLSQYTKNETVHAIFRNLCAAIFAANSDELPARAFLTYFAVKGAFKRFGFCPRGTVGLWNDLTDAIRRRGGEVWLDAPVAALNIESGRATGVDLVKDGVTLRVNARAVISNIGPHATALLPGAEAFGREYIALATTGPKPAANIVINFATRERLYDAPGLVTFGRTRRLCNIGELTATCPELAPAGWHQYVAYAVPHPALGDFDNDAEVEASLQDLRDLFPGFANAKMLSVRVMRDGWPAQRSCGGYDLPQTTPLPNFWHVGDAVKAYGDGGTQACADTGRSVAKLALDALAAA
ncbi:phytoene dehydrogenase-like protein [Variovorax boronicumulans]|uniref:phytoene desaturase family protein n=1 Tax=Variovorax boronicumulans TaxID=436515 RepID=UPI00278B0E67|nr:NAD(P)/FAD-dependent oxidoreductase [Variovorax boronicumulans]MDP9920511.1 phytoene dehydrogenase-like protein [Variovorax boronicumulans]